MFAAEHAGVTPGRLCVGKALTGGYLTLAATLCTPRGRARASRATGVLAHGPTFMGNPLACAVANASLGLLRPATGRDEVDQGRRRPARRAGAAAGPGRGRATCGCSARSAWSSSTSRSTCRAATAAAVGAGVWLRPFRDLIYTMPPYVTDDDDLARIASWSRRPSAGRAGRRQARDEGHSDVTSFGRRLHRASPSGAALCGHRPASRSAGAVGPAGRRPDGLRPLQPTPSSRPSVTGSRWSNLSRPSSSVIGSQGVAVLESTIRQLRDAGALVLLDVKRGDIGSTVSAYAAAYLDPASPLCADAITASPVPRRRFAGADVRAGRATRRRGVRAGAHLQPGGRRRAAGRRSRRPDRRADRDRRDFPAQQGCGAARELRFGGRRDHRGHRPRLLRVNGPLLAPGLGAQGGRPPTCVPSSARTSPRCSRRTPGRFSRRGPSVSGLRAAADRVLDRLPGRFAAGDGVNRAITFS